MIKINNTQAAFNCVMGKIKMTSMKKGITLILLIVCTMFQTIFACSSIWIKNGEYYTLGANLDGEGTWKGLVYINKKNISKRTDKFNSWIDDIFWTSKFGSVTFNLVCKEYPQYGMNEQGLIVSTISNPETIGPEKDDRPSMIGNFWIQYVLDMCENTKQVLETLDRIRIEPGSDRYVVCDKYGNSIIIEFQNHKIVVYKDNSLPVNVVTNQSYPKCLGYYSKNTLPNKTEIFNYITTQRFFVAANRLKQKKTFSKQGDIDFLFKTLKSIEGSPVSLWRLVFDQEEMEIYYFTKENKKQRFIDLKKIDFNCENNLISANINDNINIGETQKFNIYSKKSDFEVYKSTMKNVGRKISDTEIWEHINMLNTFKCE